MSETDKSGMDRVLAVIPKTKLAAKLGISRQAVTNWGQRIPEAYALRVSVITGIPIEKILPATIANLRQQLKDSDEKPA